MGAINRGSGTCNAVSLEPEHGQADAVHAGDPQQLLAARTPEERSKLMAEQMKLMQGGMDMMGGMGMGGMRGMGPMGAASAPMDMTTRQQMMEQRMEMMQSMMQMMMDRTAPAPATK
jgi:hypothetical protein